MKIRRNFQFILYSVSITLYATGLIVWVFEHFFWVDSGFGPGPRPLRFDLLHIHGMIGLLFLILFGALYESHLRPGLRTGRKLVSGLILLSPLLLVILTVPALYYLNDGAFKVSATWIHVYFGLALIFPFIVHPLIPSQKKSRKFPSRDWGPNHSDVL